MTEQERAERFVRSAPKLSKAEMEAINALFPTYIFRRSSTREVLTTCCHRHETLPQRDKGNAAELAVMARPHQREPKNSYQDPPMEDVPCPFCGKEAIVKELGRTGGRDNLSRYRRAVVLRWYRGALWARAYDCGKHYSDGYSLTGEPIAHLVGVYRFKPGLAVGCSQYWYTYPWNGIGRQDGPLTDGKWNIRGPFYANAEYGVGYDVIGLEEIEKSPFRYCMVAKAEKETPKLLEFLTACCFYPRQIEMLMKAGMDEVVLDLAERGVKHHTVLNWDETDPAKALRMTRQEVKAFLATKRDIRTAELYKRLRGGATMEECEEWAEGGGMDREIFRQAKKWNLSPVRLLRYLGGFMGCARNGGMYNISEALQYWEDYTGAAEAMGYQLHRENVLLPKNLGAAHDKAVAEHRRKLEKDREAEEAERRRGEAERYQARREELEKKYSFSLGGYMIRIPADREEILAEGRKLQHCVGGYADRNIRGEVTILFMRRQTAPDKPWVTIQMRGNELVQIHGYRNEGLYTERGRFAPDPKEVYKDFLTVWLEWLKKGSQRDKRGRPKLPKRKGAAA